MGIFFESVNLVNRAPVALTVTFDGQAKTLKVGDNVGIPAMVVEYAKNQNPIMGTQDPNNPHMSGARYLVGVKLDDGTPVYGDEIEPLTEAEWAAHMGRPCRTDEQEAFNERYGGDPQAKLVVHGKGRRSTATSRTDAGAGNGPANVSFERRD